MVRGDLAPVERYGPAGAAGHRRSLEATARLLFVHLNTVRYQLKRVTRVDGLHAIGRPGRLHPVGGDHHRPTQLLNVRPARLGTGR